MLRRILRSLVPDKLNGSKIVLGGKRRLGVEGKELVVNGRAGRRVACILDERGTGMESIDMEGSDE
jgi:hypothetical protein